jgi:acetolactate synthase-1/2/3 large subunit
VLLEEIPDFEVNVPVFPKVVSTNLSEVIEKIKQAKHPVLLLGENVHASQAFSEIEQLATRFQIPVMTTTGGKGTFPTNHPLSLGSFGLGGTAESETYMDEGADLMIVLGSKLNDMAIAGFKSSWFPKEVIHFDYDSTFIGKSIPVPTMRVLGDLKANLQQILVLSKEFEKHEKVKIKLQPPIETFTPRTNLLSVEQTMKMLRSILPDESMVITDAGSHSFYAIKHFDVKVPGTFFMDAIIGPMGHAIGNAIGVKCREPHLPVVCVTGDGCMLMHGTEISTAVCNQIPVIFVVINNGQLDMVEKGMANFHDRVVGVVYNHPLNVSQFAQSMGAEAFRCHNEQELAKALKQALLNRIPTVVEVMVDPTEIPPTLKRG